MATEKQIAANRLNALKSTGPRTPEGKDRASRNASRHSTLAECVLLSSENPGRFRAFVATFYDEYSPQGATETALVDMMASARWRMLRMATLEAAGVDYEYARLACDQDAIQGISIPVRANWAYRNLTDDSRGLDMLARSETRLQRQFDSALRNLRKLRADREKRQSNPNLPGNLAA